jgi:hypothetical protein
MEAEGGGKELHRTLQCAGSAADFRRERAARAKRWGGESIALLRAPVKRSRVRLVLGVDAQGKCDVRGPIGVPAAGSM